MSFGKEQSLTAEFGGFRRILFEQWKKILLLPLNGSGSFGINDLECDSSGAGHFDDRSIANVKEKIHEMHRMGFGCSLDDFGSDYSSLGLLMEFDVDAVKLDRRFFTSVDELKRPSSLNPAGGALRQCAGLNLLASTAGTGI